MGQPTHPSTLMITNLRGLLVLAGLEHGESGVGVTCQRRVKLVQQLRDVIGCGGVPFDFA
jgi:hypothetical protein